MYVLFMKYEQARLETRDNKFFSGGGHQDQSLDSVGDGSVNRDSRAISNGRTTVKTNSMYLTYLFKLNAPLPEMKEAN